MATKGPSHGSISFDMVAAGGGGASSFLVVASLCSIALSDDSRTVAQVLSKVGKSLHLPNETLVFPQATELLVLWRLQHTTLVPEMKVIVSTDCVLRLLCSSTLRVQVRAEVGSDVVMRSNLQGGLFGIPPHSAGLHERRGTSIVKRFVFLDVRGNNREHTAEASIKAIAVQRLMVVVIDNE